MQKKKRIILLEDDVIYATRIEMILSESEMSLLKVFNNVKDALNFCSENDVDLILSDIFLEGALTGIDFLSKMQKSQIPIILMTSSLDEQLYQSVKAIQFVHYLIKPVQRLTLISTIEKIFEEKKRKILEENATEPIFYVSGKDNNYLPVLYQDILWLEADGNYTHIKTKSKKMTIKKSMVKTLIELDKRFARCHHKYAVNKQHIKEITNNEISMNDILIPIGRSFRKEFLENVGI
jgi:DNA-binding LytR/AlgR family response regulator